MNEDVENTEFILYEALQRVDPDERRAFLEAKCGIHTPLRADIDSLLEAYEDEAGVLKAPADLLEEPVGALSEGPGTIIGPYKLLELIGEGGFGAVYMAEQQEPIRRRVALKIIKLGMDTKQVIARFEAERQALAMMDHPNIAKVFEAGSTDKGRPYFAMELVRGVPITEYCDQRQIGTRERLELFVEVCKAVAHAHQKRIIHRDIKPSNVLVTLHDGRPVPKVIDFGIAKATEHPLTEKTLFTEFRQLIGTPEYMSPEQAEFSGLDVDVRTDIYSLGVLLYELLTGTTPLERKDLRSASHHQMCQIVRETEPPKPSTRVSTLGEALAEVARSRQVEPNGLCKIIRGDLDWIVMRALEKDRTRRYGTANDLARDIQRHLRDEPVSAGPPSAAYRLHKFVRRHRAAVVTLALVTGATLMGATAAKLAVLISAGSSGKPQHAAGMVQRHVWDVPPNSSLLGGVSRDGRYLSYVDWTEGNLAVCDLTTKTSWHVTKNTDPTWKTSEGSNENSVVSPDGRQIAYAWRNHTDPEFYDLRIIDVDGANMRVLYRDPNSVFWLTPYDFSPDGKEVLAYFSDAEANLVQEKTGELFRKCHLVLVSVADGSVRILKTWLRPSIPKRAAFSPDGRYVAYDFAQKDDLAHRDVFLMALDGSSEINLIEHPADDRLCGWTPGGRRVVFTSDRSSKQDLWMIEVTNGAPQGEPRKLIGPFEGSPMGITEEGSLYYGVGTTASNVYIVRLDSTGLNFEGEPKLVSSQFVGSTTMCDWSPDGSLLAYRVGTDVFFGRPLAICSIETSEEHIVSSADLFRPTWRMLGPRWSPDGQSLLVCGPGQESGPGLYSVNVETGLPELVLSIRDGRMTHAVWSPDGTSVYVRSPEKLSRLDLATGLETELYKGEGGLRGVDISPDGQWVTFYQGEDSLAVLSSEGGEPRVVLHLEGEEVNLAQHSFVRWMPNGEHLLFPKYESQIWKVHVETGVQQQIGPAIAGLVSAAVHPDGSTVAFTVQQAGSALWVMENFLPER